MIERKEVTRVSFGDYQEAAAYIKNNAAEGKSFGIVSRWAS